MIGDDDRWLLSFYRASEISGALFFGRLAKSLPPSAIRHDLTKQFADEAQHAWYWTECLAALGAEPLRLRETYQERYLEAAGMPANLMEVLAITQVFEQRVIGQYALHARAAGVAAPIKATLARIMKDERWHIRWVGRALVHLEAEYGRADVRSAVRRFRAADDTVYRETLREHAGRVRTLLAARPTSGGRWGR